MFILALIFGFFAAAAALLAQVFFSLFVTAPPTGTPTLMLLVGAATLEEGAKLVFLLQLGKRAPALSWCHACLFGFGFISAEIALATFSASALPTLTSLGAMAAIHLLGTLIIYSGLRFRASSSLSPLVGLVGAILVHTLYNSSL